jgi:FkbM family methyltransferase
VTETHTSNANGILPRAWRFLQKPWHEKAETLRIRWMGLPEQWRESIAEIPIPVRLPFGGWWLARNDNTRQPIRDGQFEIAELAFVERFLKPGMTVLDLGAHHGLYTLLACKRVGQQGRVIAFEPSPRERKALLLHIRLNRCKNVVVQGMALGNEETEASLYVVQGPETGCNSLRPPAVRSQTAAVLVQITRLDDWLRNSKIEQVDFIKLDVEGGELDALKGAVRLLGQRPRPVMLAELQDVRTKPWGYEAREVAELIARFGFRWFSITPDGRLKSLPENPRQYEGNFVAVPEERLGELKETTWNGTRS